METTRTQPQRRPQSPARTLVERFLSACMSPVDAEAAVAYTTSPKVRAVHAGFGEAFPDGRVTTSWIVSEGRRVVVGGEISGTHLGEWRDTPPTGRAFAGVLAIVMFEVDADALQIVDINVVPDTFAIAEQLGLVAPLGPKACELVPSGDHTTQASPPARR